jgi:hypothetical protein
MMKQPTTIAAIAAPTTASVVKRRSLHDATASPAPTEIDQSDRGRDLHRGRRGKQRDTEHLPVALRGSETQDEEAEHERVVVHTSDEVEDDDRVADADRDRHRGR